MEARDKMEVGGKVRTVGWGRFIGSMTLATRDTCVRRATMRVELSEFTNTPASEFTNTLARVPRCVDYPSFAKLGLLL